MSKTAVNRKRGRGIDPANIYLFTFDNRNITKGWEVSSKLAINTTERCQ